MRSRTVGLVGGIVPESTVEYYRLIVSTYRQRTHDGSYPSVIVNSIDMQRMLGHVEAGELEELTAYLVGEVHRLERAGAACALLAANTPHIVFDDVRRRSPIPLISIVEATCAAAEALGFETLGLFGTRFTMQGQFYPAVFSRSGMTLAVPTAEDQEFIHDKYMNELVKGVFLPKTRDRLLAIVDRLKAREAIQALILGGTELPLLLPEETACGLPLLDTTQIHVGALVDWLLA